MIASNAPLKIALDVLPRAYMPGKTTTNPPASCEISIQDCTTIETEMPSGSGEIPGYLPGHLHCSHRYVSQHVSQNSVTLVTESDWQPGEQTYHRTRIHAEQRAISHATKRISTKPNAARKATRKIAATSYPLWQQFKHQRITSPFLLPFTEQRSDNRQPP